jgi:hypothetical protein
MTERAQSRHFSKGFFHYDDASVDLRRVTGFKGTMRTFSLKGHFALLFLSTNVVGLPIGVAARYGAGSRDFLVALIMVTVWGISMWLMWVRRWFVSGFSYRLNVITTEGSFTFIVGMREADDLMDEFRHQLEAVRGGAAEE